ncbi:MAG: glycosyltransferase family 9 protein [Flavobacteriales bacterium]
MPKSFLLIQTAFIGDVILATSVLERLRRVHPDASIDMVVRKGNEGLLKGHPFLRNVYVWDKARKYAGLRRVIREVRSERYDVVINLQRFASSGLITAAARANEKVGFSKNPMSFIYTRSYPHFIGKDPQSDIHEIDRCLSVVESFTDTVRDLPRLYPGDRDEEMAETYAGVPFVTISPASVWFTKQWPESRWVELLRRIPSGYVVYLMGAPSDEPLCARIAAAAERPNAEVLAGKLSLLQSSALMRKAAMNYTNDSAPMHLCSAVNAPVTAIFCSTIPAFGFGPLSQQSHVIETKELLTCRPCGLHGHRKCPEGHFRCAAISMEALIHTIPGA